MSALQAYNQEMRNFPHSRSLKAVNSLAQLRGATVGIDAAECFVVIRQSI